MSMLDGKVMLNVVLEIAKEEMNLFPISLMGTTIQDGGLRERRDHVLVACSDVILKY